MSSPINVFVAINAFDAIEQGRWDAVRRCLESEHLCPLLHSAQRNGEAGYNAFQLACLRRDVPREIIWGMARADRENLTTRTACGAKATPLHLACEYGSAQTVKVLLDLSCDLGKDCLHSEDSSLMWPMEVIWKRHIDPNYVSYLREQKTTESAFDFIRQLNALESADQMSDEVGEVWSKSCLILMKMHADRNGLNLGSQGYNGILQLILECENFECPSIVLWLALRLHPEQARWGNEDKDLPLHLLAQCRCHDQFESIELQIDAATDDEMRKVVEKTQANTAELLLECYPQAARTRNKDGRLPLHCACVTSRDLKLLEQLTDAAPETINEKDPVTSLFPFMLAATAYELDGAPIGGVLLSKADPDSIYMLLRANPENVRGGIQPTKYEKYLENKMKTLAERVEETTEDLERLKAKIVELEKRSKKRKFERS